MNYYNQIICGDCCNVMRKLIFDGVRVQCVVTSPPYWGLRDYDVSGQLGLEPTYQKYISNMVDVFGLVRELLTDNGVLWLNLGDCYYSGNRGGYRNDAHKWKSSELQKGNRGNAETVRPNLLPQHGLKDKDLVGIPWRVAFALQDTGWYLRQDIIWHKPNPMPESIRDRCTKSHEYVFLMTKSKRYYYDVEAIMEKGSGRTPGNKKYKYDKLPGHETKSGFLAQSKIPQIRRRRRSVWTIAPQPYTGAHFAVFPEALVELCIRAGSQPNDIVFDPFMGSGTVASVAQKLGRKWLGSELNPEYIKFIKQRVSK